jgi:hypothetical protein
LETTHSNDLKYLKDPKEFIQDACTIISRRFEADQPELLLFKNFNLEEGQLADLMTIIKTRRKAGKRMV